MYAVITGASSGIGKSFAGLLAKEGYDLVLIARSEDVLKSIAAGVKKEYGRESLIIKADLSRKKEVIHSFNEFKKLDVEIFINNAGFGDLGRFYETDLDKDLSMLKVNVNAVHIFSKLMIRYFKERGTGYILNVGSSAGLLPAGPYMATYYASKSYVVSLTKALARELKNEKSRVYIGVLCPGPVDTNFNNVANVSFALPGITAKYCASYAYKKMKAKKTVIVPTFIIQFVCFIWRFVPENIVIASIGMQQKRKLNKR